MRKFTINDIVLNRLKLRSFLIFEKVLKSSSMGEAAKSLYLTQPAVTKAIQELESQLGIQLFERSNRGVEPTTEAVQLGKRVDAIIAEIQYLVADLNRIVGAEVGYVVVGTLISASAKLLPQAINALKKDSPDILVTVRVGTTSELFPALSRGDLDCVVGRLPASDLKIGQHFHLTHEILYQERLCLVVGHQHPLANKADISREELCQYPWIIPPEDSPTRQIVDRYFAAVHLRYPRNRVESLSLMTNISLMLEDHWINLIPEVAAKPFVEVGLLSILSTGEVGDLVDVGVTTRKSQNLTPEVEKFIKALKSAVIEVDAF